MSETIAPPAADPAWDRALRNACIVIGRLGLAFLFFTQLFWKLPPTFGCSNDFAFPRLAEGKTANDRAIVDGNGSGGLCYWIGLESVYAPRFRQVLVVDDNQPGGIERFGLDISPLAQANAALLDNVVKPTIGFSGWLIWGAEAFIVLSMALGLFTRLGALTALGVSLQLYVGLANIPAPYEWEWSYGAIIIIAILLFGIAPGRIFGIDGLLRKRWAASGGFTRFLRALT